MSIESVMQSNHLILCCPLLLFPSVFPSIRVFSNESAVHMRWPKYWSFSFSVGTSNECLGSISFRIGWLDLLAVQGTLKSLLQHHSLKHQFFSAQPSLWFMVLYGSLRLIQRCKSIILLRTTLKTGCEALVQREF